MSPGIGCSYEGKFGWDNPVALEYWDHGETQNETPNGTVMYVPDVWWDDPEADFTLSAVYL